MRKRWRKARPRARIVFVVVAALVLATVGTGMWWFTGRDDASASSTKPTVRTVQVTTSTIEKSVSETGTLTPTVQESVNFAVSGTVTAVDVAAGSTVTAGQVLGTVDTLSLNADLLSAKATLASATAKLSDLEAAADGSTASTAQITAAKAQVSVASAAVTTAEADLAEATLTAPVAGLVTSVDVSVGDKISGSASSSGSSSASSSGSSSGGSSSGGSSSVSGSGSSSSSTAQFTIVGTDAYEVSLTVGDSDIAKIAVGNQVEMTSDDLSGTVYGTVASIGLVSTSSSGTAGYPVVVNVTGDTSKLHDGVSVTAKIVYSRRSDVLVVPSAAITQQNGTSYVQKVGTDGAVTRTAVTTGDTSGTYTEITAGLSSGDSVQVTTYPRTSTGNSTSGSRGGYQQGQYPGGGVGGGSFPGGGSGQLPQGAPGGQG